jgi:hypothetical protein
MQWPHAMILHRPVQKPLSACTVKLEAEEHAFHPLPVVSKASKEDIAQNFTRIRQEIADLVTDELHRMQQKPGLTALIIQPPKP